MNSTTHVCCVVHTIEITSARKHRSAIRLKIKTWTSLQLL